MTVEEINKLRFSMTSHLSMEDEHVSIYVCDNAPDGHVIKLIRHVEIDNRTHKGKGISKNQYVIDGRIYNHFEDAKQKLLEL